jgi:hypothetical protein
MTLEGEAGSTEIPQRAIHSTDELVQTIERAIAAGRYRVDGVEVALRAHAGISIAPWDGTDAPELLRRASLSAKRAVADGATSVMWLADNRTLTADDLAMLADLGTAIERESSASFSSPRSTLGPPRRSAPKPCSVGTARRGASSLRASSFPWPSGSA